MRVKTDKQRAEIMHRRAQKAEGAVAAVRSVLDGWEGTLKHYGPQLPTHDLILTTIKSELEKAIARAALKAEGESR